MILEKLMGGISEASRNSDLDEVARLTTLATRARDILQTIEVLGLELTEIEHKASKSTGNSATPLPPPQLGLRNPPTLATRRASGDIRVEINWPVAGVPRPAITISEPKSSDTLIKFVAELHAAYGHTVLLKLSHLRVSRGPLVSQVPQEDYRNPRDGSLYTHHEIPGTSFFVLTHSSNNEKVKIFRSVAEYLRLPARTVNVQQIK